MDEHRFANLAHTLASIPSRRHVLHGLAGLGLVLGASWPPEDVAAKKKKKHKGKGKKGKKKPTLPPPPTSPPPAPPPPPPGCTPTCAGKPCGTDDGCGGICGCAAGSVCHEGACHPCTITCDGNGTTCGDKLKAALANGGTIYACPGRYKGNFELSATNLALIGAGEGDDPAANTILDANQSGRVMLVKPGVSATLHRLRITGGNLPSGFLGGAGIRNEGSLTLGACTVSKNTADFSAGIYHYSLASLVLSDCTVSENKSIGNGGGIYGNAGTVTINGSAITKNRAAFGGGIFNIGSTIAINASAIVGNRAEVGGGLFNQRTVTFDSASRVTGNIAEGGAGIYTDGGTVTLNGATVIGNLLDNCAPDGAVAGCKNG